MKMPRLLKRDLFINLSNNFCYTDWLFFSLFNSFVIGCCIFWPAFGCCTLQTQVVICYFNAFCAKKLKKRKKRYKYWNKIFKKNSVFLSFYPDDAGLGFLFPKNMLFLPWWKSIFQPAFGVHSIQNTGWNIPQLR